MNVICDYCDVTGKVGTDCVHCGQPLTELVEPPSHGSLLLRRLEKLADAYPKGPADLDAAYRRNRIFWVLETIAIGFLVVLFLFEPPGYGVTVALTIGTFYLGSYLVARRGTWLGAAAVLARSRPNAGLEWLAKQPDLKRHNTRQMLVGSVQLLFYGTMLFQLFQNGSIEPQFWLVWLTGALILQTSRFLTDVLAYRCVRQHLTASIS